MEFDSGNRFSDQAYSGPLPFRELRNPLVCDLESRDDMLERFRSIYQHQTAFYPVSDLKTFTEKNGMRLKEHISNMLLGASPLEGDPFWSQSQILAAYHQPVEHSLYGKSPGRTHTLVELQSPAGFWVWPEYTKIERGIFNRTEYSIQPMLFSAAVGIVIEETEGYGTVHSLIASRAGFIEMVANTNNQYDLLPTQYQNSALEAVFTAISPRINTAVISRPGQLSTTDARLLVNESMLSDQGTFQVELTVHTLDSWMPAAKMSAVYPFGDFLLTFTHESSGAVAVTLDTMPVGTVSNRMKISSGNY